MTPTQKLVEKFFKDEAGKPILLTPLQDEIFGEIFLKKHNRLHIMAHTRFGKSLTVALAVLLRASIYPENWAIIAGTKEKAKIIMSYINYHLFDHPFIYTKFMPDKGEKMDEIRRYRNKQKISLKIDEDKYSYIFIGSAKEALGYGAQNVILDEAALVEDDEFSLVLRMLGDNPLNNFLVKIGNPFKLNHFYKSFLDHKFYKINIDCYKSLKEGLRISKEIIEENKEFVYFKQLYENKFPSKFEIDEEGWMYLLTDSDIKIAKQRQNQPKGERILGVDVARGGGNENVWVMRDETTASILSRDFEADLIKTGEKTIEIIRQNGINPSNVFLDDVGVGGGLVDFLKNRGLGVNGINFGSSLTSNNPFLTSSDKEKDSNFFNLKAKLYAGENSVLVWVKSFGQLSNQQGWEQLLEIRYKKNAGGKILIEPKDKMRQRGVSSPDVADAFALTFAKDLTTNQNEFIIELPPEKPFGGVENFYPDIPA